VLGYSVPAPGAEPPVVAASIAPVHALAAGVMEGAGAPHLLIPAGASPHHHTLKPSKARQLSKARVVFRISPHMESVLVRPLKALADTALIIDLIEAPDLTLRPFAGAVHAEHGDLKGHLEGHRGTDPHIWLDPRNAGAMVHAMAAALVGVDPGRTKLYRRNAKAMAARLRDLDHMLGRQLKAVAKQPYITFHDAYRYLEARYSLNNAGIVAVDPDRQPGARHIADIRRIFKASNIRCIFTEPQFPPRLINTVTAGLMARVSVLDPIGTDSYFQMMQKLAGNLTDCLRGKN